MIIVMLYRDKIVNLKGKIRQINIEAGALAIRKVDNIDLFEYTYLMFLINLAS